MPPKTVATPGQVAAQLKKDGRTVDNVVGGKTKAQKRRESQEVMRQRVAAIRASSRRPSFFEKGGDR